MARLRITTTERGLFAFATATAGPAMSKQDVLLALTAARIVHGIDDAAVAAFAQSVADAAFHGQAMLARGLAPVPGEDGRLEGLPAGNPLPGELRADGSIDFHERHFLVPKTSGQPIARVVAPTPGCAGRDVHGAVLAPKPGKALATRFGAGIRVDGERLLATRSGVLLQDGRQIDVVALYEHGADVDLASGNLHSDGSIVVRGDVQLGMNANAQGDLHVLGSVFDGCVQAGGSLRIDQGVQGMHAAARATLDVACRHATSASLEAGGNVVVGDQATHCRIRANQLLAHSGRGTVFGGEARVTQRISVRTAGTANGAATHFVVGDMLAGIANLVRTTNHESKVAERAQQALAANGKSPGKAERAGLRVGDATLEERLRLRQQQRELLQTAQIEVIDTLHVGVRLTFGERSWINDSTRKGVRYRWSANDDTTIEEALP